MSEKIQKVLARAGVASRRQIETWLTEGRIKVNGQTAQLGDRIEMTAKVEIDGRKIRLVESEDTRVLLYHKPAGEVCTLSDPEGRATVFENLPVLRQGRWVNIGRLDISTSGLLLFTTNGELAHRLMHPSYQIEREYAVRIFGELDKPTKELFVKGVMLEDGVARFEQIHDAGGQGRNHWYHVTLKEGRNREVRRIFEAKNITVSRLIRIRYSFITLPRQLKIGKWQYLEEKEVQKLMSLVGLSNKNNDS